MYFKSLFRSSLLINYCLMQCTMKVCTFAGHVSTTSYYAGRNSSVERESIWHARGQKFDFRGDLVTNSCPLVDSRRAVVGH